MTTKDVTTLQASVIERLTNEDGSVTIPREVLAQAGFSFGDTLKVTVTEQSLVLNPLYSAVVIPQLAAENAKFLAEMGL